MPLSSFTYYLLTARTSKDSFHPFIFTNVCNFIISILLFYPNSLFIYKRHVRHFNVSFLANDVTIQYIRDDYSGGLTFSFYELRAARKFLLRLMSSRPATKDVDYILFIAQMSDNRYT